MFLADNHGLGKCPATGLTAGTAVGAWQQFLDAVDTRVFPDLELLVHHRDQEAEEKTKILNEAYHILSDPERRKTYDRMLQYTKGKKFGEYINDDAIREKINKAYPALKKALGNVSELYSIFKDTVNGHYSLDPTHLAMIGGGLLYFILPADFIPDFIPFIGYIDDLAVLTTIMNSLKEEISEYRDWKEMSK